MLNRLALFLAGILLVFNCTTYSSATEYVDRIVAVVNDDAITLSELEKTGRQLFERIRKQAPAGEVDTALQKARSEVLSSMIDNMIVRQKAQELSITVEEAEIDMAITQMLSRANATPEDFERELALMNVSMQDYRNNIREEILKSKLIGYQVSSRIVITEDDIKKYYENDYAPGGGKDGYYILQMGFSWNKPGMTAEGSSMKEEARRKATEVRARAVAGESFKDLARSFSDLPSAVDGGDIGIIAKDEMGGDMKDTILAMHPGELSPIIETDSNFQFFKLLAAREGNAIMKAPFESVRDEIREMLYRREMDEQYNAWVENLRSQAYIKIQL
jgi:peptidyl-prolyl cis-trans isomerase SurA